MTSTGGYRPEAAIGVAVIMCALAADCAAATARRYGGCFRRWG